MSKSLNLEHMHFLEDDPLQAIIQMLVYFSVFYSIPPLVSSRGQLDYCSIHTVQSILDSLWLVSFTQDFIHHWPFGDLWLMNIQDIHLAPCFPHSFCSSVGKLVWCSPFTLLSQDKRTTAQNAPFLALHPILLSWSRHTDPAVSWIGTISTWVFSEGQGCGHHFHF